jgi:small subunit ribosomal protein S3
VDKLREELQLLTKKSILLNIVEVRKPELSSQLVADSVARQLEGRMSFRRSMKKAMAATMKMGAQGIKIQCGGRLGGAEIARTEKYMDGRVPLHTLRADIDYSTSTAHTTYGTIGVKVWICLGDVMGKGAYYRDEEEKKKAEEPESQMVSAARGRRERPERGRDGGQPRGRVRRAGTRSGAPKGRRPDENTAAGTDRAADSDSERKSPSTDSTQRDSRPRPRRNYPPRSGDASKAGTKSEGKPPAENKG